MAQSWDTSDSQIISHRWTLRPLKHILKYILYIYFSLCGSTRPQFVHLIVVASPKHWEQIIVFKSDQVYRSPGKVHVFFIALFHVSDGVDQFKIIFKFFDSFLVWKASHSLTFQMLTFMRISSFGGKGIDKYPLRYV